MGNDYSVILSQSEKQTALKSLSQKIVRILYIYEQSLTNADFQYRPYVYSVLMYASSINSMMGEKLTDVIINLNSLLTNDLEKTQIRKIVLDTKNIVNKLNKA